MYNIETLKKMNNIEILKSQNSPGYKLFIELGSKVVRGKTFYLVGEDLDSREYSYEIFESLEEAEKAFEKRLQERR